MHHIVITFITSTVGLNPRARFKMFEMLAFLLEEVRLEEKQQRADRLAKLNALNKYFVNNIGGGEEKQQPPFTIQNKKPLYTGQDWRSQIPTVLYTSQDWRSAA